MSARPIAIVAGAIANKYLNGGAAWTRLSWALGIARMGFDVFFVEQIDSGQCRDADGSPTEFPGSANLEYFRRVLAAFGLADRSALICDDGLEVSGMSRGELDDLAADASLLINISGHLKLPAFMASGACKLYVDLDPGFTQVWHQEGLLHPTFGFHDHFYTVGEAIGSPGCSIPTGGVAWKATRQPLVMELWPVQEQGDHRGFTTISAWRDDYGPLRHLGQTLGLKVHEFRRFIEFPQRTEAPCEIALRIYPEDGADRERLERHGWVIRDPTEVVPGPAEFREYVQNSGAEFSVAKAVYVSTRSGWFSDRTVRYLGSGRPALVQDTGFSGRYPVGEGLLAFRTLAEAVAGAREIARNYAGHCRAARRLAEDWFDSDKVLGRMLEEVGAAPWAGRMG